MNMILIESEVNYMCHHRDYRDNRHRNRCCSHNGQARRGNNYGVINNYYVDDVRIYNRRGC